MHLVLRDKDFLNPKFSNCISYFHSIIRQIVINIKMRPIRTRKDVQFWLLALVGSLWFMPPKTYTGGVTSVETKSWLPVTRKDCSCPWLNKS
ncbi:unnamed protein product [Blepharisma stoltei]|uniref:Uncharacterized protein n=1 Tax=Blepharisma stoltei TaxID=1481888 RepID=A0AAU9IP27_9CILI|nr:unnamed protein product [Blepharisma stoltei]